MPANRYDVTIVGSGPAAAHAAYPLVKAGLLVLMLDGGHLPTNSLDSQFNEDFATIRRKRDDQYRLFLGDDLSGIKASLSGNHGQAMGLGSRSYVTEKVADALPITKTRTGIIQSLALGGLSETWGAVCEAFTPEELRAIGIAPESIPHYYQSVITKIGVSGSSKDYNLQRPLKLDFNAKLVQHAYTKKPHRRFSLKQPLMAVLTEPHDTRHPLTYRDLEFWLNDNNAIYRSRFTIEELKKHVNFTYIPNVVVREVIEKGDAVTITARSLKNNQNQQWSSRYAVLGCGAINTTRILLRSFGLYNQKVPFLTKKHTIIPCVNFRALGYPDNPKRHSLCQLVIEDSQTLHETTGSFAQVYSYRSLLYTKLLHHSPVPTPESLAMLALVGPAISLVDVRLPSFETNDKYMMLKRKNHDDTLILEQAESADEYNYRRQTLPQLTKFLRSVGLTPLRLVDMPFGSTVHYAGGVPVTNGEAKTFPLTVDQTGRLRQGKRIYCADAATWRALPAKPPTLTIMANAERIGELLAQKTK